MQLKRLTPTERAQFDSLGYVFPLPVLSRDELATYQRHLRDFLQSDDWPLTPRTRLKPHLYLKWVSDLVRHPAVLDAVEDILGADLLIWYGQFHFKPAGGAAIEWHSDTVYGRLDREEVVTVWIALTDSMPENGCVQFDPGSHLRNAARPQQWGTAMPPTGQPVSAVLRAGEASLHDLRITHGSLPNRTDAHRCGVVARYTSAHRIPRRGRPAVSLVRGTDVGDRFDLEPVPRFDRDPVAGAWHARYMRERRREQLRVLLMNPRQRLGITARMLANRRNLRFFLRAAAHAATRLVARRRESPSATKDD